MGFLVFLGTGTRGPFRAPPQPKPRVRGEERKETGKRVPATTESKEAEVQDTEQKWQGWGREGLREDTKQGSERLKTVSKRVSGKNEISVARGKKSERRKR